MPDSDWPSPLLEWVADHPDALYFDLAPVLRDTLASVWEEGYAEGRTDEANDERHNTLNPWRPPPVCQWPAVKCPNPPAPGRKLCAAHLVTVADLLKQA